MVAAAGAVPCPQIDEGVPVGGAVADDRGVAAGAVQVRLDDAQREARRPTAASNALPPASSIRIPTADASQCVEATMPKVPTSSGRVVNTSDPAAPAQRHSACR